MHKTLPKRLFRFDFCGAVCYNNKDYIEKTEIAKAKGGEKKMKVVVVGLGKVGRNILQCLVEESHDIVAIDENAETVQDIVDRYDVMGLCGNGCIAENLKEAGVENADLLLSVTPSDEQNVLCCLIAKSLGAKNTIARVRDPEYNQQADFMREKLGIDRLVNPDKTLAQEIIRLLRFPSAEKISSFADGRVEIVEMKLPSGCSLIGKRLNEINIKGKKFSILIAAIEREGGIIIPNGETVLEEGDILSICAKHFDLCDFLRCFGLLKKKVQYVMILGATRSVYYLAHDLETCGFQVKIISPNREKCTDLKNKLDNTSVVCGDFTDKEILESEGISDADAIVAMSDYDENNIMISLFAKGKGVPKIVTIVSNDSYAGILESISLDTVISPYQVVAEDTVKYLRSVSVPADSRIVALYRIADDRAEALQFNVNRHKVLTDRSLKELSHKFREGVLITAIVRGRNFVVPNGDTVIKGDDSMIVITTQGAVSSLDDILR